MDARGSEKKLTRSERIKICQIAEKDIPEKYIAQHLSFDIFEIACEMDGEKVDLAFIRKWQQQEIEKVMKRKDPPVTAEEIHTISQTNPFTRTPFKSLIFLKELDEEIEAWVFAKEIEYIGRTKADKNAELLELVNSNLEKTTARLNYLMDPANDSLLSKLFGKEDEIHSLLTTIDMLNKKQKKLTLGTRYYDEPGVLSYEIKRLLKKQEQNDFTKEDKEELALCYSLLDKDKKGREKSYLMRMFRPWLLSAIPDANSEQGIPVFSIPKFKSNDD